MVGCHNGQHAQCNLKHRNGILDLDSRRICCIWLVSSMCPDPCPFYDFEIPASHFSASKRILKRLRSEITWRVYKDRFSMNYKISKVNHDRSTFSHYTETKHFSHTYAINMYQLQLVLKWVFDKRETEDRFRGLFQENLAAIQARQPKPPKRY